LRALAAMMVVWVHSLYVIPGVVEKLGASYFGGSGVDLFFVISGFIMVVTTAAKDVTAQRFFGLRIIRVVPLYWLATLATIACAAYRHSFKDLYYTPGEIAKSLLFIPYVSRAGGSVGVWPIVLNGWTLNYEMFFYALFALSLAAPRRLRLFGLVLALGSLAVIGRLFGPFANPLASVYTNSLLLEFVAGMIVAYLWLRDAPRNGLPLSLLAIAIGFCCLGSVFSRLVVMSGAFLVVAGCLHPKIGTLQNRPLLELGNASYAIYLVHDFVLAALAWAWLRVFPSMTWTSSVCFMAAALVLCAAAGWLCYRYIERPLTSRLRAILKGPGSVGPPPCPRA
jgi:exopolysaccharide production protein ExoZ